MSGCPGGLGRAQIHADIEYTYVASVSMRKRDPCLRVQALSCVFRPLGRVSGLSPGVYLSSSCPHLCIALCCLFTCVHLCVCACPHMCTIGPPWLLCVSGLLTCMYNNPHIVAHKGAVLPRSTGFPLLVLECVTCFPLLWASS